MENIEKYHNKLNNNAAILSILSAIIIIFIKSFTWYQTNSLSLMSTLFESLLDILTSSVNYFALKFATTPPDNNHRFGHNKMENLAVLVQSIFYLGSGIFTIGLSLYKSYTGYEIENNEIGIKFMLIIILINIITIIYQRYIIQKTHSMIIKADYIHYMTDFIAHIGVLISLYLDKIILVDICISLYIGGYIIFSSIELLKISFSGLMDKELCKEDQKQIIKILKSHKEILGAHELKTRQAGKKKFIQVHIELDPNMPLLKAHEISDVVMFDILKIFEHSEVLIHQDPFLKNKKHKYKLF